MRKYPVRVRAGLSLVRINLGSAKEYFREANFHFDRQLRDLLAEDQDKPTSYWEEDLGGITRGDLGAERRTAIESNQQLTRQFAVILAYSALERFLLLVCAELASSESPPIRKFDQIVKALKKIGIDLRRPPERSRELDRLRELRNAFAHHGGWVNLPEDIAVPMVAGYLADERATMRRAAIHILGDGPFRSIDVAIDPLERLCKHPEEYTRGMAALALGARRIARANPLLIEMATSDASPYARRAAAYALGLMGDRAVMPVLENVSGDPDRLVAENARAAMRLLGAGGQ
jgi:hypothetical protein